MVDPDARYLYYVLDKGKAIRYGVTVGEEALVFSGVAKVGRKEEWPSWTPTADIKKRLGDIPDFVGPGPHNPLGARGLYLFSGNRDTLYRIHGTNQPEYIGSAISSGCIRMTNEDVIDLYNRVKLGTPVVVLALGPERLAVQSAHGAGRRDASNELIRSSIECKRRRTRSGAVFICASARLDCVGGEIDRPGPRQRHLAGDHRRIEHIPLADPIAVRALDEIEMDVLVVIAVGARPEHRGEPGAGQGPHLLAERPGDQRVGQVEHARRCEA